jgi:hypothetical protein
MRVIRTGRICLLAMLAIGAFAVMSTNASASLYEVEGLPEVGKCTKVGIGKGKYKGGQCITVAPPERGAYAWTPVAAIDKRTFSGGGTETTIASAGHGAIKCINSNILGEYTGRRTATVTMSLQGCTNSENKQCQSGNTKSLIETLPLEAEYGFIRNEVVEGRLIVVIGMDFKPTPPLTALAMYECGGGPSESNKIEGSVIARAAPINKMSTPLNFTFRVRTNGEQLPQSFQGEPKDTLSTTFTNGVESTTAATTLAVKEYLGSNAVPLEIKAKEN